MEKDFSFVLLIIAGLVLLILFIYSLRTRVRPERHGSLELDNIPELAENDVLTMPITDRFFEAKANSENTINSNSNHNFEPVKVTAASTEQVNKPAAEKIIILNILPQEGRKFRGQDVLKAFTTNQLQYGAMSIFHRYESADEGRKILFSITQATEPGFFDLENLPNIQFFGLTLFMQLIGAEHNLKAYELFIQTAQQISDALRGTLVDKNHKALTAESTKHYKSIVQAHLKSINFSGVEIK